MKKSERLAASLAGSNGQARGNEKKLPREIDEGKSGYVAVLVPRSALTTVIEPETLSQKNVFATAGIPSRQYLETLRRPDFDVPITELGKLRLVERAAFIAWLRARAVTRPAPANDAAELDDIDRALISAGGRVVGQ